jgi:hypothetical protein
LDNSVQVKPVYPSSAMGSLDATTLYYSCYNFLGLRLTPRTIKIMCVPILQSLRIFGCDPFLEKRPGEGPLKILQRA